MNAADTTNEAASSPNTVPGPVTPSSVPASAGPTTKPPQRANPISAFAEASSGVSTTSGTSPPNAGVKNPSPSPTRPASTSSSGKLSDPVAAAIASTPTAAPR